MVRVDFSLLPKNVLFRFKKAKRQWKTEMFKALAYTLDKIRYLAAKVEIVQSRYPDILNPWILRRLQPPIAGKITSRTGKLKWMLLEGLSGGMFGLMYRGTNIYKVILSALEIRIRESSPINANVSEFTGEVRVNVKAHGRLFSTGQKGDINKRMPQETRESLLARFNWDREGIIARGGKRPFLSSSAKKNLGDFKAIAAKHASIIGSILHGYI